LNKQNNSQIKNFSNNEDNNYAQQQLEQNNANSRIKGNLFIREINNNSNITIETQLHENDFPIKLSRPFHSNSQARKYFIYKENSSKSDQNHDTHSESNSVSADVRINLPAELIAKQLEQQQLCLKFEAQICSYIKVSLLQSNNTLSQFKSCIMALQNEKLNFYNNENDATFVDSISLSDSVIEECGLSSSQHLKQSHDFDSEQLLIISNEQIVYVIAIGDENEYNQWSKTLKSLSVNALIQRQLTECDEMIDIFEYQKHQSSISRFDLCQSFMYVLCDYLSLDWFVSFIRHSNRGNQLLFWCDVEEFKYNSSRTSSQRLDRGMIIFQKYLTRNGFSGVDISDEHRERLFIHIQEFKADENFDTIFDEVQIEVFKRLENGPFLDFKQSSAWNYAVLSITVNDFYQTAQKQDSESGRLNQTLSNFRRSLYRQLIHKLETDCQLLQSLNSSSAIKKSSKSMLTLNQAKCEGVQQMQKLYQQLSEQQFGKQLRDMG